MAEQSERLTQAILDPGPQRTKRAYNRREPIRQEEVRADPVREQPVRAKKVRVRKNQSSTAPLDIPEDIRYFVRQNFGSDLMWATDSIKGQPAVQERQRYQINCWEAVTPDMFDGVFDGMFMPKGHKGEITVDAAVLLWRPYELSEEARAEEKHAANQARGIQERQLQTGAVDGIDPNILGARRDLTHLTKTRQPYRPVE